MKREALIDALYSSDRYLKEECGMLGDSIQKVAAELLKQQADEIEYLRKENNILRDIMINLQYCDKRELTN